MSRGEPCVIARCREDGTPLSKNTMKIVFYNGRDTSRPYSIAQK